MSVLGRIVNRKKTDFVGKRSLLRAEDQRGDRRQLVGVELLSIDERLEAGAHFLTSQGQGRRSEGVVTSAC